MTNLADLFPAGAGKQVSFTASGAISAAGKPVILNAEGTVTQVSETTRGNTIGSEQDLATFSPTGIANGQSWAYDETNDRYLWIYGNPDAYSRGYASVVTISTGTVSEGTRNVFYSGSLGRTSARCIGSNKFLIIYQTYSDFYTYAKVATVSGTNISYGSQVTINGSSTTLNEMGLAYSATTNASIVAYKLGQAGVVSEIKLRRLTVSGTTITVGSTVNASSLFGTTYEEQHGSPQIINNASSDEFFLFWTGPHTGSGFTVKPAWAGIVTMSSGGALAGSGAAKATDKIKALGGLAYLGNDTYVVNFEGEVASYARYCVATVSSGAVTWGTDTAYESSAQAGLSWTVPQMCVAYDSSVDKVVVTQRPTASPYNRTFSTGVLSGTTITFASLTALSPATGSTSFPFLIYDPSLEKTLFIYEDSGDDMVLRLWEVTGDITNLTATNFIGISDAAISDTSSGNITIKGGIAATGLTSLTSGSDYYVQGDGTISTVTTSPAVKIGKAMSATSINLEYQS